MSGTPPPVWRRLGLVFAFTAGCGCTLVTQHMAETGATPPQRRLAEVVSATENQHGCAPTPREAVAAMLAANRNRLSDKTKRHGYQVAYGPFLAPFIRKPIRLLEIADWYGERRVSEAVVQPLPKPAANVRDRLRRRRRQPGFHGVCA